MRNQASHTTRRAGELSRGGALHSDRAIAEVVGNDALVEGSSRKLLPAFASATHKRTPTNKHWSIHARSHTTSERQVPRHTYEENLPVSGHIGAARADAVLSCQWLVALDVNVCSDLNLCPMGWSLPAAPTGGRSSDELGTHIWCSFWISNQSGPVDQRAPELGRAFAWPPSLIMAAF